MTLAAAEGAEVRRTLKFMLWLVLLSVAVHLGYYMAAQDYKQLCDVQCHYNGGHPWSKRLFWHGSAPQEKR